MIRQRFAKRDVYFADARYRSYAVLLSLFPLIACHIRIKLSRVDINQDSLFIIILFLFVFTKIKREREYCNYATIGHPWNI